MGGQKTVDRLEDALMVDARRKYEDALAAFAQAGARWANKGALTYWGKASGLSADEIIADAHSAGVVNRDADIRRGWNDATPRGDSRHIIGALSRRHTLPTPKPATDRVRHLIEAGMDITTTEALHELSPVGIRPGSSAIARRIQTETHLQLLFGRSELVHIRQDKDDWRKARIGLELRQMGDWLFAQGDLGEIIRPNPFTGKTGTTSEGKPSLTCRETIAAYRHMVFEFDEMPLADQCRFWAGFIRRGTLPLVSLTYSGAKSIHGVIRVDAPDSATWMRYRGLIVDRYACDHDPRYRLDEQAIHPLTGTRLAGSIRKNTGKVQELLFDCGK